MEVDIYYIYLRLFMFIKQCLEMSVIIGYGRSNLRDITVKTVAYPSVPVADYIDYRVRINRRETMYTIGIRPCLMIDPTKIFDWEFA